jgi:hypothetical protein
MGNGREALAEVLLNIYIQEYVDRCKGWEYREGSLGKYMITGSAYFGLM